MTGARLIAVGGMSGSGKTTLADALGKHLSNAVRIDSDRVRKKMFAVAETDRLPPDAYTPDAHAKVATEINRLIADALKAGKTVIVSATFLSSQAVFDHQSLARDAQASFAGIWLQADLNVLFDRVARRKNNPSDAGVEIVRKQMRKNPQPPAGWTVIDSGTLKEKMIDAALAAIKQSGVKPPSPPQP